MARLNSMLLSVNTNCDAKIRINSETAKEMRVFLFFLVKRVGERGVGMAF